MFRAQHLHSLPGIVAVFLILVSLWGGVLVVVVFVQVRRLHALRDLLTLMVFVFLTNQKVAQQVSMRKAALVSQIIALMDKSELMVPAYQTPINPKNQMNQLARQIKRDLFSHLAHQ